MFDITPIPAFTDNYIWCLHQNGRAWVVDPGDANCVMQYLEQHQLTLTGILITHHHPDHIGGVQTLLETFPDLIIFGPTNPQIAGITHRVTEGMTIEVFDTRFSVLEVPGHTLDHIAFVSNGLSPTVLFCGDTLFSAGCGRLFEGTPAQMFASLGKFKNLPATTQIYCTHEYTQANLRFATAVDPDNLALQQRVQNVEKIRANHLPSIPTTLSLELETNPFLRTNEQAIRNAALQRNPEIVNEIEVFAAIRRWKDGF